MWRGMPLQLFPRLKFTSCLRCCSLELLTREAYDCVGLMLAITTKAFGQGHLYNSECTYPY